MDNSCITMHFGTNIYADHRTYPNFFGDFLTFHLVQPASQKTSVI